MAGSEEGKEERRSISGRKKKSHTSLTKTVHNALGRFATPQKEFKARHFRVWEKRKFDQSGILPHGKNLQSHCDGLRISTLIAIVASLGQDNFMRTKVELALDATVGYVVIGIQKV